MANVTGQAVGNTTVGANYKKHAISQSGVGEEVIVKIVSDNDITDAELDAMINYITTSHGTNGAGDSAHTVGAVGTATGVPFVAGTTDTVFLRAQGTGDHDAGWLTAIKAAGDDQSTADSTANVYTITVEAVFKPAK